MHDARRRGKPLYALWLDTANAFNSVNHQVIWSILRGYGLSPTDVAFLESIHQGNRFSVSGPFGETAQVHMHAGVGQGDITSPLLWNLVINALIRYLNGADCGYQHESGETTSVLAYIDDAVLLADSSKGIKTLVSRLNKFYEWAGLKVNHAKCAIFGHNFNSGKALATNHLRIHGRALPVLSRHGTYKYLGMEVSPGGGWTVEKQRVRSKLAECVSALKGSPYLPEQLDQVVRACLLPIFRYGAGLVDWTDRELQQITNIWATARRLAWKLAPGSPHALHTLSSEWGGGDIPAAKLLWAKEMMSLWNSVRIHDDSLRRVAHWEWQHSREWIGCNSDDDAAHELTTPIVPVRVTDLSNRF